MKESQLLYGIRPVIEALRNDIDIEKVFIQSSLRGGLLEELKDKSNRKARFKSVVALVVEGRELLFEGIINGTIICKLILNIIASMSLIKI